MRSFLRIFLRATALVRTRKQRLEIGRQRAGETEIGGVLVRQQREGIGGAAPGQRLVAQHHEIGAAGEAGEYGTQSPGVDSCCDVTPPQADVEIGVFAAEELDHGPVARRAGPSGSRNSGVPRASKPTTMKGVKPASTPTWRCQRRETRSADRVWPSACAALQRAPVRFRDCHVVRTLRPARCGRPLPAVADVRHSLCARRRRSWRGAGKIVNAGQASQRYINKELEYSRDFARQLLPGG